nr:exocyst complex component SEC10 [Tanacetum cinerariifolium]
MPGMYMVFQAKACLCLLRTEVPGAAPVARAPYRLAPFEIKDLSEQLKELSNKGLIRHNSSPWGAPVLLVKKEDGSFQRCIRLPRVKQTDERLTDARNVYGFPSKSLLVSFKNRGRTIDDHFVIDLPETHVDSVQQYLVPYVLKTSCKKQQSGAIASFEQKANDYKSLDDGIVPHHRPTNACIRVVAYLSRVLEATFTALEGLNKQTFLTESGNRLHKGLSDHWHKYTFNPRSMMPQITLSQLRRLRLKQDITEHEDFVQSFNAPTVDEKFKSLSMA